VVKLLLNRTKNQIANHPYISFGLGLFFLCLFYGYAGFLRYGAYSVHLWRQADCLSMAYHYYAFDYNFFHPSVLWIGDNTVGYVASELPIIYWLVASIWKVIGHNHWVFRGITMLIFGTGLIYLFKTAFHFFKSFFWASFTTFLFFTSTTLVYYAAGFLPNTSALGIALIGLHFFYHFVLKNEQRFLWVSVSLFLIAGLLKLTALFGLAAVSGAYFIYLIKERKGIKEILPLCVPYLLGASIIISWVLWTKSYNSKHFTSFIFLQDILPFWELPPDQYPEIFEKFMFHIFPFTYHYSVWMIILIGFGFALIKFNYSNKFLLATIVFMLIGISIFIALWFKVFDVHDYYLINLLVIVPAICFLVLDLIKRRYPFIWNSMVIKMIAALWLGLLMIEASWYTRVRFDSKNDWLVNRISIDLEYKEYCDWILFDYEQRLEALTEMDEELKVMGVDKEDYVMSIPDGTINWSLYALKRRGFTDYGYIMPDGSRDMQNCLERNGKFLIVNDSTLLHEEWIKPFTNKPVGIYRNVKVFKLD
tara:strand:- start:37222 stop:38823 length:1602 start_codon:yes stop_codon:yes gene_type:complete